MMNRLCFSVTCAALIGFAVLTATGFAQQLPVAPPPATAIAHAVDPGQPPAPAIPPVVLETNPAVLAALEWPRERPADALRAVLVLVDLDRPLLAKPVLDELAGRNLSPAEQAALVAEFGSYRMLQLAQNQDLAPAAVTFAEACMAAASSQATDPIRLAELIAQLGNASAAVRHTAVVELKAAGQTGVKAFLESLAQEADPHQRADELAAAAALRPLVDRPLLAMLDTSDIQLRGEVGELLLRLRVTSAVPLVAAGNSASGETALQQALADYQRGTQPFAVNEANHVELWHWDDATKTLSSATYSPDAARILWMARLARQLSQMRPDDRIYLRRAVALDLEAAGLSQTAPHVNLHGADMPLLNAVLAAALADSYAHAAAAVCDELGRRGDAGVLITHDGQPSPLADALQNANRHVRFAALAAIMTLDPQAPYPGSSRVPEALEYFARGTGRHAGLVAMPTTAAAADVAGKLTAAGIEGEASNIGRDVATMARQSADLELALIDMDIHAPGVRQVLYELRTTTPAGELPVALLAADGRLEAAHRLAEEHQRVIAVPRPHTAEAVAHIADQLRAIAPPNAVTAEERALEAVEAVVWTAGLLEHGRSFYALRRTTPAIEAAMFQPAAATAAFAALARLGTPESQQALFALCQPEYLSYRKPSPGGGPLRGERQAHGLLLTTEQIADQYHTYNASASADSDTQQVLGTLLDTIESQRAATASANPA